MGAMRSLGGPLGIHVGPLDVLLKSLGDYLGSFGIQKGAITRFEDCFRCSLSNFQKHINFPMNFNDLTYLLAHLDTTWGAFWGDFGTLWTYFGATLG